MSKPANPTSVDGVWDVGDTSAPGHATGEVMTSKGGTLVETQNGEQVSLPFPEATWWNRSRIGSRGFTSGAIAQPTILFDGGFAITMSDGSFITV